MTLLDSLNHTFSSSTDLIEELKRENEFLLKIVDTIPAKIYFNYDIQEKIASEKHAIIDSRLKGQNRNLSVKSKHKRARLDPSCQKSVSQIHSEMGDPKKKYSQKKKGSESTSLTRAANIEELQKRVQERINELKLKRKALGRGDAGRRKLENKMKKIRKKATETKSKVIKIEKANTKNDNKKKSSLPPTYNKEGTVIYGKLDFSENGIDSTKKKSEFSGKNYKALLKQIEKKNEKMENIKSKDPEKASALQEKDRWKKAILKSENVKVKDDPTLLKKSLKRQEKKKNHSAKKWKERTDHVDEKKKYRQEKRDKNIKKRKDDKLKHKIKRAKKKGRVFLNE